MIALTGSLSGTVGMKQSVTLEADTTYTFSAYIKTTAISPLNTSDGVYLAFTDSAGNVLARSERIYYQTANTIDNGWEKISVTWTPSGAGSYHVAMYIQNATGTACGDDFQLETGDAATSTNLLQDGSFEDSDNWDTYWNDLTTAASRSSANAVTGSYSGKITGAGGSQRWICQTVRINQPAEGKTFILSGWGKGTSVAYPFSDDYAGSYYSSRRFAIIAKIHYSDTTEKDYFYATFNYASTDWQYASVAITPKHPDNTISYIEIWPAAYYVYNNLYYDDISLVMEPTQTYTYDSEGNPVSATGQNEKTEYTYEDGTSILESYTDLSGVQYNLTHESGTHNLLTTTSAGVTVTNTYDAAGNDLAAMTTASGTADYLRSGYSYSSSGNHVTQYETVNGVGYRYTYSTLYHRPTSSRLYGLPKQYYSYYSNSDRLYQTYISSVISLAYNYSSGNLTGLKRKTYLDDTTDNPVWQYYNLNRNAFGGIRSITIQKSTDGSNWSSVRTLASYTYSGNNGHLEQMTYGNGAYIQYGYDLFDRVVRQTYNDGTAYGYRYNANGDLAAQYELNADGGTVRSYAFEYDSLDRLIRSRETDADGNLVQRTEHIYDNANRLTSQSYQIPGTGTHKETYTYDSADGKLTKQGYVFSTGGTASITLSYDALKRLETETAKKGSATVYTKTYDYRDSTTMANRTTLQVTDISVRDKNNASVLTRPDSHGHQPPGSHCIIRSGVYGNL